MPGINPKMQNANGQFKKGNASGRGCDRKHTAGSRKFNKLLYECVTDADFKKIVKSLVAHAKAGKMWAVKEILDRCLGRPVQATEIRDVTERPEGEARTWGDFMRAIEGVKLPFPKGVPQPKK